MTVRCPSCGAAIELSPADSNAPEENQPVQGTPVFENTMTSADITRRQRPEMSKEQIGQIIIGTVIAFIAVLVTILVKSSPPPSPALKEAIKVVEEKHGGQRIEVLSKTIRRGKRYGGFWIYSVKMRYKIRSTDEEFKETFQVTAE